MAWIHLIRSRHSSSLFFYRNYSNLVTGFLSTLSNGDINGVVLNTTKISYFRTIRSKYSTTNNENDLYDENKDSRKSRNSDRRKPFVGGSSSRFIKILDVHSQNEYKPVNNSSDSSDSSDSLSSSSSSSSSSSKARNIRYKSKYKLSLGLETSKPRELSPRDKGLAEKACSEISISLNICLQQNPKLYRLFRGYETPHDVVEIVDCRANKDFSDVQVYWDSNAVKKVLQATKKSHPEEVYVRLRNKLHGGITKRLQMKEGVFRSHLIRDINFKRVPRLFFKNCDDNKDKIQRSYYNPKKLITEYPHMEEEIN